MKITCISDLHGHYPELEGGDLLIIAGDLTAHDEIDEYLIFNEWLSKQDYQLKIVVPGNHDNYCELGAPIDTFPGRYGIFVPIVSTNTKYLCDSGTEFEGLKIWGSPWTKRFEGMNPKCMAFTVDTEEELAEKWALIPDDTDILITHGPRSWFFDKIRNDSEDDNGDIHVGSTSLLRWIANHVNNLKLHVHGHIHEGYGKFDIREMQKKIGDPLIPIYVNCSYVNERYQPVNKPIIIEI